jgi:hypothetical protein
MQYQLQAIFPNRRPLGTNRKPWTQAFMRRVLSSSSNVLFRIQMEIVHMNLQGTPSPNFPSGQSLPTGRPGLVTSALTAAARVRTMVVLLSELVEQPL